MAPSAFDLGTAVVVVTGSGSGIGRGIARSFARRGPRVVVSDVESEAAVETCELIRAEGGAALPATTDVASRESVASLADLAYDTFGRVDLLCNNAGVTLRPFRAIWEASADDFEWLMRVNYLGVVNGLLAFLPRMRLQPGHKHIVNTSSMTTLANVPGHGAYIASKAAVDALSDVLREEFIDHGDDFGVTVVHPSNVTTRIATSERLRSAETQSVARGVRAYPFRRADRPVKNTPIDLSAVGEMVVAAVLAGAPYVLTHQADLTALHDRADAQAASFALYSEVSA